MLADHATARRMKSLLLRYSSCVSIAMALGSPPAANSQTTPGFGAEEFGMTRRELIQAIERGEELIARCMQEQGFQYVAADYNTVHAGMKADKSMPGLSEEEFINKYGFGVATTYTGQPPQLAAGYSPTRVGLGERNVQVFKSLSPADQAAYNRALFGDNPDASFAVALETENLAQTGGCTRKAIDQIFKPEETKPSYYNPQNAFINSDPRMKTALRKFVIEMKKSGFDYNHPDDVEPDIRSQLAALTSNSTIRVDQMTAQQRSEFRKLQDYERRVATKTFELQEKLLTPVEEQIQQELFARKVQ
jgi:hypothetical protein